MRRLNVSTLPMRCHLATVTLLVPFQLMFGISKGKVTCRLSTANEAHRISILHNLPLSSRLLRNVNVHSSPTLVFILRQTNSFHIPTIYFFKIHSLTLATYLQMGFPPLYSRQVSKLYVTVNSHILQHALFLSQNLSYHPDNSW